MIWRSVEKLWDDDGNTISCRWGECWRINGGERRELRNEN